MKEIMKIKFLLIIAFFLTATLGLGQNQKEATKVLKKIKKIEQVEKYKKKKKYSDWKIQQVKTMGIDSVKYPKAVNSEIGEIFTNSYDNGKISVLFKVLSRKNVELSKVQYIFFDGSKMNKSEIDSTRTVILNKYTKGTDFTTLVKEYTMDGNPTGDLPWFHEGMMVKEFEEAVMPRQKGEIFTSDVDSRKWYYVVLKTHDNIITSLTELVGIQYGM